LTLGGETDLQLVGYTDSDWANCLDTRRSMGGFGFSLGAGLILWNAKKQKTVASSSCKAKYTATAHIRSIKGGYLATKTAD